MRLAGKLACTALLSLLGTPLWAASFTITPTFDSSFATNTHAAVIESVIQSAIKVYESTFSDPINVAITFDLSSSLDDAVSETEWTPLTISYDTFSQALQKDAKDATDTMATAANPVALTNPVNGTKSIHIKPANAKALGISPCDPSCPQSDATIMIDPTQTDVEGGHYSLLTAVEHEMDEALGLGSSLGVFTDNNPSPEDLFRYNASGKRSFSLSSDVSAYFSLNGTTDLAQFDNSGYGDYGDWLTGAALPQVQDALMTQDESPVLSVNEITALDAIGYDLATPEPGSLMMMITGAIILFLSARRVRVRSR